MKGLYVLLLVVAGAKKLCIFLYYKYAYAICSDFLKAVEMIILDGKNLNFFLIFAQNINCAYTLEPP